jgi:PTS system beta-glucosides-specific IIC component
MKRRGVQIIYGTYVDRLKNELESYLCSLKPADEIFPDEIIINDENIMQKLYVPIEGDIIDMGDIPDFAFQTGMLGNGIGIRPQRGELRAPANGKIARIFQTGHAIIIHLANDIVVLLHIGIGTVALEGKGFLVHVKEGQVVRKGELLISFDLDDMIAEGCELTSPMIIMNSNECGRIIIHKKERTTFEDVALTVLFPEPTL